MNNPETNTETGIPSISGEVGVSQLDHDSANGNTLADNPDFKNGVMAVDPTTIGLAFRKFSDHVGIDLDKLSPTPEGERLFAGLAGYTDSDFDIHDVVTDAGSEEKREGMNALAVEHGFGGPFDSPFSENQIGVLAIVDKKMKWFENDAEETTIYPDIDRQGDEVEGVKFNLESYNDGHFKIYYVKGFPKPVVRIAADPEKSDGTENYMWVTEIAPDENPTPTDLFEGVRATIDAITQKGVQTKTRGSSDVASISMPKLSDVTYERDWTEINDTRLGGWKVTEVKQKVRVSIDEIGAEAAAMTSMLPEFLGAGPVETRERIVLGDTGPMLVWFTEGDSNLPICATITNEEAWEKTAN